MSSSGWHDNKLFDMSITMPPAGTHSLTFGVTATGSARFIVAPADEKKFYAFEFLLNINLDERGGEKSSAVARVINSSDFVVKAPSSAQSQHSLTVADNSGDNNNNNNNGQSLHLFRLGITFPQQRRHTACRIELVRLRENGQQQESNSSAAECWVMSKTLPMDSVLEEMCKSGYDVHFVSSTASSAVMWSVVSMDKCCCSGLGGGGDDDEAEPSEQRDVDASSLRGGVKYATYGPLDVTKKLRDLIKRRGDYKFESRDGNFNKLFGDPLRNEVKELKVHFSGTSGEVLTFREGEPASFTVSEICTEDDDGGVTTASSSNAAATTVVDKHGIDRATYGGKDVTRKMRSLVAMRRHFICPDGNFNRVFGINPAPSAPKKLVVELANGEVLTFDEYRPAFFTVPAAPSSSSCFGFAFHHPHQPHQQHPHQFPFFMPFWSPGPTSSMMSMMMPSAFPMMMMPTATTTTTTATTPAATVISPTTFSCLPQAFPTWATNLNATTTINNNNNNNDNDSDSGNNKKETYPPLPTTFSRTVAALPQQQYTRETFAGLPTRFPSAAATTTTTGAPPSVAVPASAAAAKATSFSSSSSSGSGDDCGDDCSHQHQHQVVVGTVASTDDFSAGASNVGSAPQPYSPMTGPVVGRVVATSPPMQQQQEQQGAGGAMAAALVGSAPPAASSSSSVPAGGVVLNENLRSKKEEKKKDKKERKEKKKDKHANKKS